MGYTPEEVDRMSEFDADCFMVLLGEVKEDIEKSMK